MRAPPFLGLLLLGACADPTPWGPNAPTDPGAPTGAEVEVATALHEVPPAPEAEAEGDHAMMHHPDAPAGEQSQEEADFLMALRLQAEESSRS